MAAQIGLRKLLKKERGYKMRRKREGMWGSESGGVRESNKVHLQSKCIIEILKELIKIYIYSF